MEIYSPFHRTFEESKADTQNFHKDVEGMNVSDETLEEYLGLTQES
jgi:hypothetical protein